MGKKQDRGPRRYCTKLMPMMDGTYKHCDGRIIDKYKSYRGKDRQKILVCSICGKIYEKLTIDQMAIR